MPAVAPALAPDRAARRAEFQARAQARFAESDRNHDGRLSRAEFQDAADRKLAQRFHRLDGNNDGQLTQDELRQAHAQRRAGMMERRQARAGRLQQVRVLDTNRDQALDRAEIGNRMPRPRSDAPARPLSAGPVPRVYFRAAGAMGKSPARV